VGEAPGLWSALSTDERESLAGLGARRRVAKGSIVFLEGDDAHDALLIKRGDVKVTMTSLDGHEVVLAVLGADDIVGELAPLDGQPRSANAVALTDVEVVAIPAGAFVDFLERHPKAMRALLGLVTGRLRDTTRRQVEFGTVDALGRTCARLVELAQRWGVADGHDIVVRSPVSQSDLAAWTGLSREAVVKALRALRQLGWIDNHGREIRVHDLRSLQHRGSITL
jgi:CRP-like cAMP-binding protein